MLFRSETPDDAAVASTIGRLVMDPVVDALDLKKPVTRNQLSGYFFGALSMRRMWSSADEKHIPPLHKAALARYTDGVSTTLSGVTTDGYDSQARRHGCKANIKLKSKASGQTMEVRGVAYTVQATAKDGEFQVEVPGLDGYIAMVSKDATDYVVTAIIKGMPDQPARNQAASEAAQEKDAETDEGD